jgi:tRNA (guanine37-N1)-methyltransferase
LTKLLRKLLQGRLTPEEIEQVAGGFDAIGDLAVVKLPEGFPEDKKRMVADVLLSSIKSLKAVWNQVGPVEGDYRIRRLEFLGGEGRSTTIHLEHGCKFMVDISKMYFSPRLSAERERVASLVREKEEVFNMFAGVGTFSIVIAKKRKGTMVYSAELNKEAYDYMVQNVYLNKVQDRVAPLLGDSAELWKRLPAGVDRVLMPLPEKAADYLQYAINVCRPGSMIHYYAHVTTAEPAPHLVAWEGLKDRFPGLSLNFGKVVREVGPRTSQVVLDLTYGG